MVKKFDELAKKHGLKDFYVDVNRSWVEGFVRGRYGMNSQDIVTGYEGNKAYEYTLFYKFTMSKRKNVALYDAKKKVMWFLVI